MALFSKDGKEFVELPDSAEDLDKMKQAGYEPYLSFTSNGEEYIALPAEVSNLKKMQEAGYKTAQEWTDLQRVKEESKVKFGAGEAFGLGAAEEGTLGLGKYAVAAGRSLTGGPFGKDLEAIEYQTQAAKEQAPLAYTGGRIAGGVGTGLVTGAIAPAATLGRTALKGAGVEAVTGLVTGTALSEEKDLGSKLLEGGASAVLSAAGGAVGGALSQPKKLMEAAKPTVETVKAAPGVAKSAFSAGIQEARENAWLGLIPGVGRPLAAGAFLKGAISDVISNNKANKQFSQFVDTLRNELGEDAAKIDDMTLFNTYLAQAGDNPAKEFLSNLIVKDRNLTPDDALKVKEYLVTAPELSKAARSWNIAEKSDEVATTLSDIRKEAQKFATDYYDVAKQAAREKFTSQPTDTQKELADSLKNFFARKEITGSGKEAVEAAFHELHGDLTRVKLGPKGQLLNTIEQADWTGGKLKKLSLSSPQVQGLAEEVWQRTSPAEQFDRYTAARVILKNELPSLDKTSKDYQPFAKWSQTDKEIDKLIKGINQKIKSADEIAEADIRYGTWSEIGKELKSIFGNDFSPRKVMSLMGDSNTASLLGKNLQKLENRIVTSGLPEEQATPILDTINVLKEFKQGLINQTEMSKTLYGLKALDEATLKRLNQLAGKGAVSKELIQSPLKYSQYQQEIEKLAQGTFNKGFNELTKRQQFNVIGQQMKGKNK